MKYEYLLICLTDNTFNPRSGIENVERFQRELTSAGQAGWRIIEADLESFRALAERPIEEPKSSIKIRSQRKAEAS